MKTPAGSPVSKHWVFAWFFSFAVAYFTIAFLSSSEASDYFTMMYLILQMVLFWRLDQLSRLGEKQALDGFFAVQGAISSLMMSLTFPILYLHLIPNLAWYDWLFAVMVFGWFLFTSLMMYIWHKPKFQMFTNA